MHNRACLRFPSPVVCVSMCAASLAVPSCRVLGLAQRTCKWLQALTTKAPTQPTDLQDCCTARSALSASQGVCTNAASREVDERGAVGCCWLVAAVHGSHGGAGQQGGGWLELVEVAVGVHEAARLSCSVLGLLAGFLGLCMLLVCTMLFGSASTACGL